MKTKHTLVLIGFLTGFLLVAIPFASAHEKPQGPPLDKLAEKWGIDLETLESELESGKTLQEVAEELGFSLPEKSTRGHKKFRVPKQKLIEAIAESTGASEETIEALLEEDGSLHDIAESYGIDFDEWVRETFPPQKDKKKPSGAEDGN